MAEKGISDSDNITGPGAVPSKVDLYEMSLCAAVAPSRAPVRARVLSTEGAWQSRAGLEFLSTYGLGEIRR
ncbi:hypothetical protein NDU88_002102 [Pleurodeles waltl]|uniref:Uncharacterized protein n=1 Tax=Pleurodeles waltl TaxID=8319 RepID=A0AAV7Q8X3_PLEWA|nr:hypothetical protein NDU88_002102 [Pleurodeles waltl]